MFNKVLIANRGAIATRLIRTLKRMGIQAVAVYAAADANSRHVALADEAWPLGEGGAAETYLDIEQLLTIARQSGAEAIHPGYGFLSEHAEFVRRCDAAGVVFIGPSADHIETFGLKHRARAIAQQQGVPLLPGTDLLSDRALALQQAEQIGYPIMVKSTAGGGGIGLQRCDHADELEAAWATVQRLGAHNFANDGLFLEKFIPHARHIEVQIFADGTGQAIALGERDCSSQRRNQKVVEETPAPHLSAALRHSLHQTAERLLASVAYRSAGTVEFIVDAESGAFYFLEVNTRLQVEHGVTEEVYGVDLVEWMVQLAAAELPPLSVLAAPLRPQGHAIQVRLYAEDPYRNFQPCAGLLSEVYFPQGEGVRIEHWIESGIEIPAWFDPMLAKVIVHAESRTAALHKLQQTLAEIRLYGSVTNLDYLRQLSNDPVLVAGTVTTRYLNDKPYQPRRIDILQGGTQTTLQDYPGRQGYWSVGVPPSGPFDHYSFRLANRLLGNDSGCAALEITLQGPWVQSSCEVAVVIGGADIEATLDGVAVPMWQVVRLPANTPLHLGRVRQQGARSYLAVQGGFATPDYLGSQSTFTLGQFGGHNGRALRAGDVIPLAAEPQPLPLQPTPLAAALRPPITHSWQLRVIYGPHGAPDFFTEADITTFFTTAWQVHYNSSRTGVRLIGPKPQWARHDGGEAGLHPSNIHDNAYAFGTVDFTGDMPVILGPDGPSLGGFVCPATVITADLWKIGQLRAGDTVQFVAVTLATAVALEAQQLQQIDSLMPSPLATEVEALDLTALPSPLLLQLEAERFGDTITYRAAGDHFVLVEYGEQQLDIRLRFRAHALMEWLTQHPLPGLRELTPGIRSLQIHFDRQQLSHTDLLAHLQQGEQVLATQLRALTVPSRIVHLPLSWDDVACQLAIEKYTQSVRSQAPWCPSNLEFIRRINGLESIDAVKQILFTASYLVMGLGDVYLGAPVATPIDPRHRLVTTKYNPARTWTAENSVGIGGSYLCVYGMEGPGGYQFVGRTLQMWNRYRQTAEFSQPWLLRFFDQIRFYEVSNHELTQIRRDFPQGRYRLNIEESEFSLAEYEAFLAANRETIELFTTHRNAAFAAELQHWHASGQFNFETPEQESSRVEAEWPEQSRVIDSPVSGSLWQCAVQVGDQVASGDTLLILESMKMEIAITASGSGEVTHLLVKPGQRVDAGQALVVLKEANA